MRAKISLLLLLLLSFVGLHADYDFVTAVTLRGYQGNDRIGVGTRITNTSGAPIDITQLGRWTVAGNSQTHTLSIYTTTSTLTPAVASVVVDTAGAPAGQFLYGTLSSPYTLAPNATVYIISSETIAGDRWEGPSGGLSPGLTTPGIATTSSAAVIGTTINLYGNSGSTYTAWGPVTFRFSSPDIPGWTKPNAITYNTNGYQYAVASAINDSSAGNRVNIPAGSFTYGGGNSTLTIPKAITVMGAGTGSTTINISSDLGTYSAASAVTITSNAVFGALTMVQPGGKSTSAIRALSNGGWRITDIHYTSAAVRGYFVYAETYGLVDHCYIDGGGGNDEWIFMRGPASVWNSPAAYGTANAVYLEDNTFYDQGYFDANYAASVVARFNTVTPVAAIIKFDDHGYSTNGGNSARFGEMYANYWTTSIGSNTSFEIRGGTGIIFGNTTINTSAFYLTDYGYLVNGGAWGNYQTPSNYPVFQQVGSGPMATINATDLVNYQRAQIVDAGTTTLAQWQAIGAPNNNVGAQFTANGPAAAGTGTVYVTAATEPMYIWGNRQQSGAIAWPRTLKNIGTASSFNTDSVGYSIGATSINLTSRNTVSNSTGKIGVGDAVLFANHSTRYLVTASTLSGVPTAGSITISPPLTADLVGSVVMTSGPLTAYQQQTGNNSATFSEPTVIQSNRNFYADAGFDTNTGVTVGTAAQMLLATPTDKHGFWVTDEGAWNFGFSGTIEGESIAAGYFCEIVVPGSPSFTTIGAKDNLAGTQFVASGPQASGTGTVKPAQGRLYVGDGANWNLYYTPYRYPHPLQGTPPSLLSATINEAGSVLTLVWSESCTTGAGGNGGVTITPTGGAATATYSAGSGSNTYTYSLNRTISGTETVTTSYTQPGNGIESTVNQTDVASYSDQPVTNQSTAGAVINATTFNVTTLNVGP